MTSPIVGLDAGLPQTQEKPAPVKELATVNGAEVTELAVLIKPVAFLVTTGQGTHEISRVFYQKGKFRLGVDMERVGGLAVERVVFDTQKGMFVTLTQGYTLHIPNAHMQVTWRR